MKTKDKSVRNGLILKGFRKQNGITAKELGRSVNRADKTVYHWENGRNIPKDILEKLSSIYGIKFNGVKSTKQNKSNKFWNEYQKTGMTYAQFGSKYNMSTAVLHRIAKNIGRHYFSMETLKLLAKDYDLNKLFG